MKIEINKFCVGSEIQDCYHQSANLAFNNILTCLTGWETLDDLFCYSMARIKTQQQKTGMGIVI
jgi:hypothetical protein